LVFIQKVRVEALNCLKIIAEAPEISILPLKQQVVREIRPCLSDKKRLVRKAAADARCAWYLVGEIRG
jgi:hypothetical protein